MKLHELFEKKLLLESAVTMDKVLSLDHLIDPKTGKYYTGVVNVTGDVDLSNKKLSKLPVKFGKVGGNFDCDHNYLTSLRGAPSSVGLAGREFYANNNKITSLEGIHKIIKNIDDYFNVRDNPIKSGGIGLILVEGLNMIKADQPAFDIIEKYLGQGKKGVLLCQEELIEAGYEEYARL